MRTLIIDNEPAIVSTLKKMLGEYCPELELIGTADGVVTGLELIRKAQPDLIFLDVEMGDGTGLDVLHQVSDRTFQVIFITAYGHYAVEAFRLSALDFLLKPIDPEELMRAVGRARVAAEKEELSLKLSALMSHVESLSNSGKKIVLKDAESVHILLMAEITHCQAEGSYTRFFLQDKRQILVSKNLKEYEKLLQPHGFFRPHHSHLVNVRCIVRFDKADGGMLILSDGSTLPVSHRKREQLIAVLSML